MKNSDEKCGVFFGDEPQAKRTTGPKSDLIWFAIALVVIIAISITPAVVLVCFWKFVPEPVGFWQRFVMFAASLMIFAVQLVWVEAYSVVALRRLCEDLQDWRRNVFRIRSH